MADIQNHSLEPLTTANYSSAIARAVEWLGDRYLLAKPINAAPKSRNADGGTHLTAHADERRTISRHNVSKAGD